MADITIPSETLTDTKKPQYLMGSGFEVCYWMLLEL
jgi:hypothetical protein